MVLEFKKCLKTLKANRQLDNCTYQGEKKAFELCLPM